MSCQQRDMDLYLLLLYLSAFVSEFRLKTRLTVSIQQLVCLANVEIKPELYLESLHLLKTWSLSIFHLTYILCFLGLVLLLLSACWRDSSWVSRFSSCCALQKNLTERWEVIQRELDSLPQVVHYLLPYFAWPFADLIWYFSNYIPPVVFFPFFLKGSGGGVGGLKCFMARKNQSINNPKIKLAVSQSLWEMNALGRSSFQDLFQGDPGD